MLNVTSPVRPALNSPVIEIDADVVDEGEMDRLDMEKEEFLTTSSASGGWTIANRIKHTMPASINEVKAKPIQKRLFLYHDGLVYVGLGAFVVRVIVYYYD